MGIAGIQGDGAVGEGGVKRGFAWQHGRFHRYCATLAPKASHGACAWQGSKPCDAVGFRFAKNISAKGLEYSAEWNACTCASWRPAHKNASPKSSTRVEGPMNGSASLFGTTAQISPPRTQIAKGRASSLVPVNTFSLIKTDSACMRSPLAHISWCGATAGQRPSGSPRMLRL